MSEKIDYLTINKAAWNNRTNVHLKSDFYDLDKFIKGDTTLYDLDIKLLGDIRGKKVLHLQCHFGMDTISLARMGAEVAGMDFSEEAIESARKLNEKVGTDVRFVCCDIYDLAKHLDEKFDIVYTSYGVIGWLPDLDKWGAVAGHFLKPGGRFVMCEFHPVLWMLDEEFKELKYAYSNPDPIVMLEPTYTDNGEETVDETATWNHGLGDTLTGLIKAGINIKELREHYYSPCDLFNTLEETSKDEFKIKGFEDKVPMIFSIVGEKI